MIKRQRRNSGFESADSQQANKIRTTYFRAIPSMISHCPLRVARSSTSSPPLSVSVSINFTVSELRMPDSARRSSSAACRIVETHLVIVAVGVFMPVRLPSSFKAFTLAAISTRDFLNRCSETERSSDKNAGERVCPLNNFPARLFTGVKKSIYFAMIVAWLSSLDSRVSPAAIFPATELDWIGLQLAFLFDGLYTGGCRT